MSSPPPLPFEAGAEQLIMLVNARGGNLIGHRVSEGLPAPSFLSLHLLPCHLVFHPNLMSTCSNLWSAIPPCTNCHPRARLRPGAPPSVHSNQAVELLCRRLPGSWTTVAANCSGHYSHKTEKNLRGRIGVNNHLLMSWKASLKMLLNHIMIERI